MVMNLNTRDGNVFWYGNPLWQNTATYGTVTPSDAFATDIKSPAWSTLSTQTHIMIMVHQQVRLSASLDCETITHSQGVPVCWKSWRKSTGAPLGTMSGYFTAGNCVSANSYCSQVWLVVT